MKWCWSSCTSCGIMGSRRIDITYTSAMAHVGCAINANMKWCWSSMEFSIWTPCDFCHWVSTLIFYRSLQGPGLVNLPVLATKLGRFTKANVPAEPTPIIWLDVGSPWFFDQSKHLSTNDLCHSSSSKEYLFHSSLKGISPMDRERDHVPCRSSCAQQLFHVIFVTLKYICVWWILWSVINMEYLFHIRYIKWCLSLVV